MSKVETFLLRPKQRCINVLHHLERGFNHLVGRINHTLGQFKWSMLGFIYFPHFSFQPTSLYPQLSVTFSLPVSWSPGGTALVTVTGVVPCWSQQHLSSARSATSIQRQTPIWGCGCGVGRRADQARVLALCHALWGGVALVRQAAASAAAAQRHGFLLRRFSLCSLATGCRAPHGVEPGW